MSNNNRNNVPYNDATGEIISWIVVFIFMVAFWPIGLILLLKRLSGQPKNAAIPAEAASARTGDSDTRVPARAKKRSRNPLEKKTGKFAATILLLISIALFIFGANTIAGTARDIWAGNPSLWPEFGLGIFYLIGGLIVFSVRNTGVRRFVRYKNYYAFVDNRDVVPISDIAQAAGRSGRAVKRDLQAMINSGYFSYGAYIDSGIDSLVLSAEAALRMRRAAKNAVQAAPLSGVSEKPENQYMAIIVELRELNATISDILISDKIDRIEELTAKIFRIVEDDPAKLPQIRRFMDYYLPTTLKLLHTYATLEKQGVKGRNITSAKENIGRTLDKLVTGFAQQLDQLFKADVIDIAADISVLENMMKQDGLKSGELSADGGQLMADS